MMWQDTISIIPDVVLVEDVGIFTFVNLYGCDIGKETKIASFGQIQNRVSTAQRCESPAIRYSERAGG